MNKILGIWPSRFMTFIYDLTEISAIPRMKQVMHACYISISAPTKHYWQYLFIRIQISSMPLKHHNSKKVVKKTLFICALDSNTNDIMIKALI